MSDIDQFRKLAQPPPWALKTIGGGRLRGMTDIKPAWRIQAMTEVYGLCGLGWKYEIARQWTEPAPEGQVFAFVDVLLYIRYSDGKWSDPIPGTGGNMLIEKEKAGLHANDEAWKMANTDALSSAMRMIGMAADVYAGQWTGSKYARNAEPTPTLSVTDQVVVERRTKEIAAADTLEAIEALGNRIRDEDSPAVQNELRDPIYTPRWRELKKATDAI